MGTPSNRAEAPEGLILGGIVAAACTTRALTLWLGRPDFAGWFNHVYYYFVQVRGLLQQGSLPYPDMPLLFYLDALGARLLIALGMHMETAVMTSTRLVMCIVPSLLPLPVYGIVRGTNRGDPLRVNQWFLVAAAGFLPLSISHMPELLQKNVLGLFLLSVLMYCFHRLLGRPSARAIIAAAFIALLIVISHFGTAAAMMMYAAASIVSYSVVKRSAGALLASTAALAAAGGAALWLVHSIDVQRYRRVFFYLRESVAGSLVASAVAGTRGAADLLLDAGLLAGLFAIFLVLWLAYRRRAPGVPAGDRVFWLANILFCCLLILPILDQRLMGRLALFLSLPLILILAFTLKYGITRRWIGTGVALLAGGAVLVLAFGELVSARIHNANHEAISADLEDLRARGLFGPEDLIVTRTGAEHVCNWFFGAKAGVITSLNLRDFERFQRVFVLNPGQGAFRRDDSARAGASEEARRYRHMLEDIPRPEGAEIAYRTENLEVFRLDGPPREWEFDDEGAWSGYGDGAGLR